MKTNNKDAAEAATALKDKEISWRQLFKERARLNRPALIYDYDYDRPTLQVLRKKSTGQLFPPIVDDLRD